MFCLIPLAGGAAFVHAFDELMSGSLAEFVKLSADIGGDVKTQVSILEALAGYWC